MDYPETQFLTSKQLCDRWQCSHIKLRRMRAAGELSVHYIGHSIRYAMKDILDYEDQARVLHAELQP